MFILEQLEKKNLQSTLNLLCSPAAKEYIKTTYANIISIDRLDGILYLWLIAKGNKHNKELKEKIKELKGKIIEYNPDLINTIKKDSKNYRTDDFDLTYHAFKMAEEKNDIFLLNLIYDIEPGAGMESLYDTKVWSDLTAAVYLAGYHMPKMWELINRQLRLLDAKGHAGSKEIKHNTGHYSGRTRGRGVAINSISIASITLR